MNANLNFFKACFKNEMQSTVNLLAAMPNDNLSYKPHPVNRSAKEIAEHILAHVLDLKIIIENTPLAIWDWNILTDEIFQGDGFFSLFGYDNWIVCFR